MSSKYNPQQQALIDAPIDTRVVGVAGAGTGKTTTMIARAKRILEEYQTGNLMLITFTRAAANDLRKKIESELEDTRRVTVGTFHSIIGNLIRINATTVGLEPNFTVIDEKSTNIMYRNIAEAKDEYIEEMTTWLLEPNDKSLMKKHFNTLASSVGTLINTAYPEEIVTGTFSDETLYRLKKTHRTIKDDNVAQVANLLHRVFLDSLIDGHRTNTVTYDHILFIGYLMVKNKTLDTFADGLAHTIVDEYQDTNMLQDAFIRYVGGDKLTIVGDIDQSIYEFRGGKPSLLADHANESTVCNLSYNYRSYQPILDLANNVIQYNNIGKKIRADLKAMRPFDEHYGGIELTISERDGLESDKIIEHINFLHKYKDVPYSDMAVLIRSRMTLASISRALTQAKIPMNDTTKYADFMKSDVVTDTLNFLKVFTNPKDIYAFLGIIDRPKQGIGPAAIAKLQGYAEKQNLGLVEFLLSKGVEDLTPALKKKIENFTKTYLSIIENNGKSDMSLGDLIQFIYTSFGYETWLTGLKNGDKYKRDLITMKGLIREFEEEYDKNNHNTSLYDIANAFVFDMSATTREETNDGVCITTVHNAKGLEWEHVFLIGLEAENFPGNQVEDENDMESERRLMYVAVTRAKKSLHLFASKNRITSDKELTPSNFISEMGITPTCILQ